MDKYVMGIFEVPSNKEILINEIDQLKFRYIELDGMWFIFSSIKDEALLYQFCNKTNTSFFFHFADGREVRVENSVQIPAEMKLKMEINWISDKSPLSIIRKMSIDLTERGSLILNEK